MSTKLNKAELRQLFDQITKDLAKMPAEIEVASLQLDDHIDAQWLPLLGLSYDPSSDSVAVVLKGIDVSISKPRELYFDGDGEEWAALDIIDEAGMPHVVQLKEPARLPAPEQPLRDLG
jgi:hypothetical protein